MTGTIARVKILVLVIDVAVEVFVGIRDVDVNALVGVDCAAFVGDFTAGTF